jgi:hypothetical protein
MQQQNTASPEQQHRNESNTHTQQTAILNIEDTIFKILDCLYPLFINRSNKTKAIRCIQMKSDSSLLASLIILLAAKLGVQSFVLSRAAVPLLTEWSPRALKAPLIIEDDIIAELLHVPLVSTQFDG